jgi:predicted metal-dependent hydrolase
MTSTTFWQGIDEFNRQEFYACHDTLEALWMDSAEPQKTFYQGILQIAVGCYHLENGNGRGAAILLGEGIRRLHSYPDDYEGIDLARLRSDSHELLTFVQELDPDRLPAVVEQWKHPQEHPPAHLDRSTCSLPKIHESHWHGENEGP